MDEMTELEKSAKATCEKYYGRFLGIMSRTGLVHSGKVVSTNGSSVGINNGWSTHQVKYSNISAISNFETDIWDADEHQE